MCIHSCITLHRMETKRQGGREVTFALRDQLQQSRSGSEEERKSDKEGGGWGKETEADHTEGNKTQQEYITHIRGIYVRTNTSEPEYIKELMSEGRDTFYTLLHLDVEKSLQSYGKKNVEWEEIV